MHDSMNVNHNECMGNQNTHLFHCSESNPNVLLFTGNNNNQLFQSVLCFEVSTLEATPPWSPLPRFRIYAIPSSCRTLSIGFTTAIRWVLSFFLIVFFIWLPLDCNKLHGRAMLVKISKYNDFQKTIEVLVERKNSNASFHAGFPAFQLSLERLQLP